MNEERCDKCRGTFRNRNGVVSRYASNVDGRFMYLCEKCMFKLK